MWYAVLTKLLKELYKFMSEANTKEARAKAKLIKKSYKGISI
jgi:hypothetical protein